MFSSSVIEPVKLKSVASAAESETDAVIEAAMPVFVTRIAPDVMLTVRKVVVPLPSASDASLIAIPRTLLTVSFSKVKEPVSRWPKTSRLIPVPVTLTPGETVVVPTVWLTAVVFSCSANVPLSWMFGIVTATFALSVP